MMIYDEFIVEFLTCWFGGVAHEIDKVLRALHHLDVLVSQVLCDAVDQFSFKPVFIFLNGKPSHQTELITYFIVINEWLYQILIIIDH